MNWALLLPGYLVTGLAFGAFTLDLIGPRLSRTVLVYGGAAVMAAIGVFIILANEGESSRFAGGILIFDTYSTFFFAVFRHSRGGHNTWLSAIRVRLSTAPASSLPS